MIFDVTKPFPKSIDFDGKKYNIDLSYNNVLNVFDIFKESELIELEKNQFALSMLISASNAPPRLLEYIFNDYISITKKSDKNVGFRTVDFRQDGVYLYSSFLHDYGIDLVKQRNKLHWWQFVSLFQGLSEGTKMREVMRIRQQKIPERNKHNTEYIANLIELKQYYALDISQEEREQNFKRGLAGLAENLRARAR